MRLQPPLAAVGATCIAPSRTRVALLLLALFTFFFAAFTFSASADFFSTGDTSIRIQLAENLVDRGSVELFGWTWAQPRHLKKEFYDPRIDRCNGMHTCSTYLLGQPLAIIPFDEVATRLATHERWPLGPTVLLIDRLVGPLFGALEAVVFFLFACRLAYGMRRSLLLTLIFAFATMAWPDEQSVLEHSEVAFFLLLAMYGVFRFRDQRLGQHYLVLAGIGIGGAAITRYQDAALGLVGLAVYLFVPGAWYRGVLSRLRAGVIVGLGLAPFVALDVWFNEARFGQIFASGHHETVFGYVLWKGVLGLTVSPGKGLLWYSPTIFLLAIAMPRFARRYGAFSLAIVTLAAAFVLLYGYVTYWHGDPAWGPRYIYPIVPFLTLPLGELLRWHRQGRGLVWLVTGLLVVAGFAIQFSAVSVSPWRSWYRVISYEESQGHTWEWIAARYRYHWNVHESPLLFQLHGLYQLAYDDVRHSSFYEIVPPDEDPILDDLTATYAINQWNFWWKSDEFDWWMGQEKVIVGVVFLVALMLASGTYLAAESAGIFSEWSERARPETVEEAA